MATGTATISVALGSVANNPWRLNASTHADVLGKVSAPVSTQCLDVTFDVPAASASWQVTLARDESSDAPAVIAQGGGTLRVLKLVVPTYDVPGTGRVPFTSVACTCAVNALDANGTVIATASAAVGG